MTIKNHRTVDLIEVMKILLRRIRMIIGLTVFLVILGLFIIYIRPVKFEAKSTMNIAPVSIQSYKFISKLLVDKSSLRAFISKENFSDLLNSDEINNLRDSLRNISVSVRPVYSYDKSDLRIVGKIFTKTPPEVIAVQINVKSPERDVIGNYMNVYNKYLRDVFLIKEIKDRFVRYSVKSKIEVKADESSLIKSRSRIRHLEKKRLKLIKLEKESKSRIHNNKIMYLVNKTNSDLYTPSMQLVSNENAIIDLKTDMDIITERLKYKRLLLKYYIQAEALFSKNRDIYGLRIVNDHLKGFFSEDVLKTESGKLAYNSVSLYFDKLESKFNEFYYITSKKIDRGLQKYNRTIYIIAVLVISFIFSIFLCFIFEWIKNNRKYIKNIMEDGNE